MSIINAYVEDQRITITARPLIASGGANEDVVLFNFSEIWDGFVKTAVFYIDNTHVYHVVIDENNRANVPTEILAHSAVFYFGVFGVRNDGESDDDFVRLTSEVKPYTLVQGAFLPGSTPPAPTPDIYEQLIARYGEIIDDLNGLPYCRYAEGEGIEPVEPIINDDKVSNYTTYSSRKTASLIDELRPSMLWEGKLSVNETCRIDPTSSRFSLFAITLDNESQPITVVIYPEYDSDAHDKDIRIVSHTDGPWKVSGCFNFHEDDTFTLTEGTWNTTYPVTVRKIIGIA